MLGVLMMSLNLSDIVSFNIHSIYYHCLINRISKIGAVNLQQNADFRKKSAALINYKISLSYMKNE